ncbi:hypothetical protein GDO78_014008 [Eleutherodactylus coqui]|uniref:Uncharacterized protein n=1 Tax=Eleutherodactylus coqui TaxID=57060 RepID=A0A8J6JWT4_ELECQ|nr:hypothetical protein GDO78_014008 [Eleutherodactylus coqui]
MFNWPISQILHPLLATPLLHTISQYSAVHIDLINRHLVLSYSLVTSKMRKEKSRLISNSRRPDGFEPKACNKWSGNELRLNE